MNQLFARLLLVLAVAFPVAATAQDGKASDIASVDASWNRMRLASDVDGLSGLLLDDWVLTHSDGRVEDKAGYLADLRKRTRINHAIDNFDVQVRRHGDTAIVTGRTVQSGVGSTGPFSGQFRFTRVWVLREGQWRMAASHSSRIPEAERSGT